MSAHSRSLLDRAAIGLSGLCIVHCLALPALALALPLAGALAEEEAVHLAFLLLALPLSFTALLRSGGWRSPLILSLAALGMGLIAAGPLGLALEAVEVAATVSGGLLLSLSHLLNLRRCGRVLQPAL